MTNVIQLVRISDAQVERETAWRDAVAAWQDKFNAVLDEGRAR